MRGRIVELAQISAGAPEQYEGRLDSGESVFVRERGGTARVELNGIDVCEKSGDALEVLSELFDIDCEIRR